MNDISIHFTKTKFEVGGYDPFEQAFKDVGCYQICTICRVSIEANNMKFNVLRSVVFT